MTPWDAPVAAGPIDATLSVPGSKSASARALVLAALADGPGEIHGLLDARDTRLMRAAIESLGAEVIDLGRDAVRVEPPASFHAGRTIDCGLSGTVMRFVPPLAALADGTTDFVGDPAATDRPVAPLLAALGSLGAGIAGDAIPFSVTGPLSGGGPVQLDASGSSQFVSALLLVGSRVPGGLTVRHVGPPLPSRPHIEMTVTMLVARGVAVAEPDPCTWIVHAGPIRASVDRIEPDLTNAASLAAAALVTGGRVRTAWPESSTQAGDALLGILRAFGAVVRRHGGMVEVSGERGLRGAEVDLHAVSEITCVAAALAALAPSPSRIGGVGHIRGHETDRLAALRTGLGGLGAAVIETTDGLAIDPAPLHGGAFATHADHRLAHAGALLGLAVPGVRLDDVACTTKTLPDFPRLWTELLGRVE